MVSDRSEEDCQNTCARPRWVNWWWLNIVWVGGQPSIPLKMCAVHSLNFLGSYLTQSATERSVTFFGGAWGLKGEGPPLPEIFRKASHAGLKQNL